MQRPVRNDAILLINGTYPAMMPNWGPCVECRNQPTGTYCNFILYCKARRQSDESLAAPKMPRTILYGLTGIDASGQILLASRLTIWITCVTLGGPALFVCGLGALRPLHTFDEQESDPTLARGFCDSSGSVHARLDDGSFTGWLDVVPSLKLCCCKRTPGVALSPGCFSPLAVALPK